MEVWFILFFFSLFYLFYNSHHLLNSLLSLEMMSLSIYFALVFNLIFSGLSLLYSLYYLVMVVCEGMLGISLLVGLMSVNSGDSISSFYLGVS